jgi:predicted phage tail protein
MKNVFDLILKQSQNLVTLVSFRTEEDTASAFQADVVLAPTEEALKNCGSTYQRWYTNRDEKGLNINLKLYGNHFYIRAFNTPVVQSTKKRNVTDATPEQMAAAFRAFLKNIFKEMEKSQAATEKQKKASWSLTQIANHYEAKNSDRNHPFTRSSKTLSGVSVTLNTNETGQPLKKIVYNMLPSDMNENLVSGEITLSMKSMTPAQLQQVLDKISEITALS